MNPKNDEYLLISEFFQVQRNLKELDMFRSR